MKYKLNITNRGREGVFVNDWYFCNSSILYINSFDSLQEAYEECTNSEWLEALYGYIGFDDCVNHIYWEKLGEEERHNLDDSPITKRLKDELYEESIVEWIDRMKRVHPWWEIEKLLLKYNMIIKESD